jgi:hypothetical protein
MDNAEARGHGKVTADPVWPAAPDLQVVIPFRTPQLTKAALKHAARFAQGLNARVRLIDVHVVPYGVPLDRPTVNPKHLTRRLRQLAQESAVPVFGEVVYARDWEQGLRRSLAPGSLVLMAIKRSWWRSSEKRLATRLRRLGHQIVWIDSD